jgi:hypothetical protein
VPKESKNCTGGTCLSRGASITGHTTQSRAAIATGSKTVSIVGLSVINLSGRGLELTDVEGMRTASSARTRRERPT